MIQYLGLWVLIALAVNMWALLSVVRAEGPLWRRVLWVPVLLVPVLGFVLWYLFGSRQKTV